MQQNLLERIRSCSISVIGEVGKCNKQQEHLRRVFEAHDVLFESQICETLGMKIGFPLRILMNVN